MKKSLILSVFLVGICLLSSCQPAEKPENPVAEDPSVRAGELLKSQKPEEAHRIYLEILKKEPGNASAQMGLAASLLALGRGSEALEILVALQKDQPDNPEVLTILATACRETGRSEDAEKTYQELEKKFPLYFPGLLEYGRFLAYEKKSPEAVGILDKTLKLDISDGERGEALITRACAYFNQKDPKRANSDLMEALKSLNRAIPAEADRHVKTGYLISRAFILKSIGKPAEALKDLEQAISTGERDAECYFFMTGAYIDLNREDEAIRAQEKYESLDRDFKQIKYRGKEIIATYHRNSGSLWFSRGELEEALKSYEKSLRIEPENPEGLIESASIMFMLGRVKEARVNAKKFLSQNPPSSLPKNMANLAEAFRITGRYRRALHFINGAIEGNPDEFGYYFERAFIYLLMGKNTEFERDLKQLEKMTDPEQARMARDFFIKVKENREIYMTER